MAGSASRALHPSRSVEFHGATFLKQALIELAPVPVLLRQPASEDAFAAKAAPLRAWVRRASPEQLREGESFPENESVQTRLLNDGGIYMAMILDPTNPPTLAVLLTRLFVAPDIHMLLPASAGAHLQLGLVALAFALLVLTERIARRAGRWWLRRGGRGLTSEPILRMMTAFALLLAALGALAIQSLALWSIA